MLEEIAWHSDVSRHKIGEVNWAELKSAHGTCEHYPDVFHALVSEDEQARQNAYWQLDNYAVLQGDLFEVAPYVADVLVGILQSSGTCHGRGQIYDILVEISSGYAAPEIASNFAGQPTTLKKACDLAIRQGIESYLEDISHDQRRVRLAAADLLLDYPDACASKVPLLQRQLRREPDQEIRKTLQELLDQIS